MYDNKVRLSQDVLEKAELIAAEWGLKNARAAIEAVFRKYADDYLYGRQKEVHTATDSIEQKLSHFEERQTANKIAIETQAQNTSTEKDDDKNPAFAQTL